MKRLALTVSLNGAKIGTIQLDTSKRCVDLGLKREIQSHISTMCFMRGDDLLATHDINEFDVRGTAIQVG